MTENEGIVAHPQQELEKGGIVDGGSLLSRAHHICPTSSGTSKKVG